MKRLLTICILVLCCINIAKAQDALCYRLPNAIEHSVEQSYISNSTIELDSSVLIDGITISGHLTLQNRHSLARVILVDVVGYEYLLYEGRYWGNDALVQNFEDMAIETAHMVQTSPAYLKIAINHATLYIEKIKYSVASPSRKSDDSNALRSERHERLVMYSAWKSDKWRNYNAAKGIPWIAHETPESQLSYSEKKQFYGITDDNFNLYGLEHYAGGYFVFPDTAQAEYMPRSRNRDTSQFVDHFDWRDRHGKNWMTIPKNQHEPWDTIHGNGGCWAFAAVSSIESRLNLFYNQLLNADLSEQEIGSCAVGNLHSGGLSYDALVYIRDHGITTESCFPFENNDTVPCEKKCNTPDQIVSISGVYHIEEPFECDKSGNNDEFNIEDSLKYEIINHGPLASSIDNEFLKHVMCLCGYKIVQAGDSIHGLVYNNAPIESIVGYDSPYLGQTCWIYKNSNGPYTAYNGYLYVVIEDIDSSYMKYHDAPIYPIRTSALSDSDIAVTDADNDGYYFWGLGPKPSHCPICCPDIPDGDDSDPTKAEMDSYGNFAPYTFPYPTVTITNDTTWNTNQVQCGNVVIANNATLTITAELTMNPAATITIQNGGTLVVNAGSILNAEIDMQTLARLRLLNNGTLHIKQDKDFNVPFGAEADIVHGRVMFQ